MSNEMSGESRTPSVVESGEVINLHPVRSRPSSLESQATRRFELRLVRGPLGPQAQPVANREPGHNSRHSGTRRSSRRAVNRTVCREPRTGLAVDARVVRRLIRLGAKAAAESGLRWRGTRFGVCVPGNLHARLDSGYPARGPRSDDSLNDLLRGGSGKLPCRPLWSRWGES